MSINLERLEFPRRKEEEEKEEEKKYEEEVARDVLELMRGKRKIPREKLPEKLRDLVTKEEIKIKKYEFQNRIYFDLGERVRIRIGVPKIEPPKVEVKITKMEKGILKEKFRFYPKEDLANEIIEQTGILGLSKDKEDNWIILKKGRSEYIKLNHFDEFKKRFGIETEEELRDKISSSIRDAYSVKDVYTPKTHRFKYKRYRYTDGKGEIETRVNSKGAIITSFPV